MGEDINEEDQKAMYPDEIKMRKKHRWFNIRTLLKNWLLWKRWKYYAYNSKQKIW